MDYYNKIYRYEPSFSKGIVDVISSYFSFTMYPFIPYLNNNEEDIVVFSEYFLQSSICDAKICQSQFLD